MTPIPTTVDADDIRPDGRDVAGRWIAGQSGNPGGARRKTDADRRIEELARAESEVALAVVIELMSSAASDRTRLAAAIALLERAHGKVGDRLVEPIELPAGANLAEQGHAVMLSACRGDITPAQAGALMSCLSNLARVVDVAELAQRLSAIEFALKTRHP